MSKKILVAIGLCGIMLAGAVSSENVFGATQCNGVETSLVECGENAGGINHTVQLIMDNAVIGVGILAVIGIAVAGIQFLTAGDNAGTLAKAKKRILEIIIGLVCFVALWGVARWILPGGDMGGIAEPKVERKTTNIDIEEREEEVDEALIVKNDDSAGASESGGETSSAGNESGGTATASEPSSTTSDKKRKKVIIILGASQVERIARYKVSFTGKHSGQKFSKSDGTLNFFYSSGSGFGYESGTGWALAQTVFSRYGNDKDSVSFYVFFTLSGNDIAPMACGSINSNNSEMEQQIAAYDQLIASKKSEGFQVIGYVTSVQPVQASNKNKNTKVVANANNNRCKIGYRSNFKYNLYNSVMHTFVNGKANVFFINTFNTIMNSKLEFASSWKDYKTTDGIHWDKSTAKKYFTLWMNMSGQI